MSYFFQARYYYTLELYLPFMRVFGEKTMSTNRIFRTPPTIHVGQGASQHVGAEVKNMGLQRALLVTDSFLFTSGIIQPVLDSLKQADIQITICDTITSEPTLAHVDEAMSLYKAGNCQGVIACGGGSPIDVAKAVSVLVGNGGNIQDYLGLEKVPQAGCPIIAIPTTAGTGSEATLTTIITDTQNDVKMLIISSWLMPKVAIIDPMLTLAMPKGITAATGLDALTHAIEAYVSRKAQPLSDLFALSAVRRIYKNLPLAWAQPENMEAREQTLLGALEAGIAFSNASVALVHGMSRPIGALFHVPHGVSNAALLGVVTHFSLEGAPERYAAIAHALGVTATADHLATAKAGAEKITQIIKELEIPPLSQLGVNKEKLDAVVEKMAHDAIASGSPGNNPRIASEEEIISLYYQAL